MRLNMHACKCTCIARAFMSQRSIVLGIIRFSVQRANPCPFLGRADGCHGLLVKLESGLWNRVLALVFICDWGAIKGTMPAQNALSTVLSWPVGVCLFRTNAGVHMVVNGHNASSLARSSFRPRQNVRQAGYTLSVFPSCCPAVACLLHGFMCTS